MERGRSAHRSLPWLILACIALYMLCLIAQHMVFVRLPLLGGCMKPAAAAVVAAAVLGGGVTGAVSGFFVGLCMDAMMPGEAFHAIYLCLLGMTAGRITAYYMERNLAAIFLWSAIGLLVMELLYFFLFFGLTGRADFMGFLQVGLRDALITQLTVPLVYLPLKRILC